MKYIKYTFITSVALLAIHLTPLHANEASETALPPTTPVAPEPLPPAPVPTPTPTPAPAPEPVTRDSVGLDHHYVEFSSPSPYQVQVDSAIPFNSTAVAYGTSISQSTPQSFTLHEAGNYLITFTGYTTIRSALGSVQLHLNNEPFGAVISLNTRGSTLILQQIVSVTDAPVSIEVNVLRDSLTLVPGTSASLCVVKLK